MPKGLGLFDSVDMCDSANLMGARLKATVDALPEYKTWEHGQILDQGWGYARSCIRTSENSVKRKFNFVEIVKGEVRRMPLPRTPVNTSGHGASDLPLGADEHRARGASNLARA
jgi:hypothetical protein